MEVSGFCSIFFLFFSDISWENKGGISCFMSGKKSIVYCCLVNPTSGHVSSCVCVWREGGGGMGGVYIDNCNVWTLLEIQCCHIHRGHSKYRNFNFLGAAEPRAFVKTQRECSRSHMSAA